MKDSMGLFARFRFWCAALAFRAFGTDDKSPARVVDMEGDGGRHERFVYRRIPGCSIHRVEVHSKRANLVDPVASPYELLGESYAYAGDDGTGRVAVRWDGFPRPETTRGGFEAAIRYELAVTTLGRRGLFGR